LERYLKCIENLNYNKKLITIYIVSNNNIDNSYNIIENWAINNQEKYSYIEIERGDVKTLIDTSSDPHNWTDIRLKILSFIRNKSLQKTKEYNCDYYFTIDCDNFINPDTLNDLIEEDKPIIAPMLIAFPEENDNYSNFFYDVTPNGYCKSHKNYNKILRRDMIGTFEVPVVHSTYLIKKEYIDNLSFMDETTHHDYVIFGRFARGNNIKQYICNKKNYGTCIHFNNNSISLDDEKVKILEYYSSG